MADDSTAEGGHPRPLTACSRCGGTEFEDGRRSGLSKEIFCKSCGAGYRVNVLHDGLYLVDTIGSRPRRRTQHLPGPRRRTTDR